MKIKKWYTVDPDCVTSDHGIFSQALPVVLVVEIDNSSGLLYMVQISGRISNAFIYYLVLDHRDTDEWWMCS